MRRSLIRDPSLREFLNEEQRDAVREVYGDLSKADASRVFLVASSEFAAELLSAPDLKSLWKTNQDPIIRRALELNVKARKKIGLEPPSKDGGAAELIGLLDDGQKTAIRSAYEDLARINPFKMCVVAESRIAAVLISKEILWWLFAQKSSVVSQAFELNDVAKKRFQETEDERRAGNSAAKLAGALRKIGN
jgi:hypothetical protein